MTSKQLTAAVQQLMHTYSLGCCGKVYGPYAGKPNAKVQYLCQVCRKEMKPKVHQVMDEDAATLIARNLGNPALVEQCPECNHSTGHHVVRHTNVDAWFLNCGNCGDELRELEWEEVL